MSLVPVAARLGRRPLVVVLTGADLHLRLTNRKRFTGSCQSPELPAPAHFAAASLDSSCALVPADGNVRGATRPGVQSAPSALARLALACVSPRNVRLGVRLTVLRVSRLPRHCEGVALPEQAFNRGLQRYRGHGRVQGRKARPVRPDSAFRWRFARCRCGRPSLRCRYPSLRSKRRPTPLLRVPKPLILGPIACNTRSLARRALNAELHSLTSRGCGPRRRPANQHLCPGDPGFTVAEQRRAFAELRRHIAVGGFRRSSTAVALGI